MIKFLVWALGVCAIGYAFDKMALWHEVINVLLAGGGLLWMIGGAVALGGSMARTTAAPAGRLSKEDIERLLREQIQRRERHGESVK